MNWEERRLFIPISLGNHFYSSRVIGDLIRYCVSRSERSVFFLCDNLRLLSYRMQQKYSDEAIQNKVMREVGERTAQLNKCGLYGISHAHIATWSDLSNVDDFRTLLNDFLDLVQSDQEWADELRRRSHSVIHSLDNVVESETSQKFQEEYICEETVLSIFMTEKADYSTEIYRRRTNGFVDWLYCYYPGILRRLIGKDVLSRQFISIEEELFSYIQSCSSK